MTDPNWPPPAPPAYITPRPGPVEGELAGWGPRVGAALIDGIIVTAVIVALLLAAASGSGNGAAGAGVVVAYLLAYLYAPLTMMRKGEHNGQTFGKQAVGIRVRRDTGAEMGFWYSALREILVKGLVGTFTLGIDYLWPLWDKRNQALHDKVANTVVIEGARPGSP
jgi:uncharacterized RDD family membrane protein YckC